MTTIRQNVERPPSGGVDLIELRILRRHVGDRESLSNLTTALP
jgi:hypothetical protein